MKISSLRNANEVMTIRLIKWIWGWKLARWEWCWNHAGSLQQVARGRGAGRKKMAGWRRTHTIQVLGWINTDTIQVLGWIEILYKYLAGLKNHWNLGTSWFAICDDVSSDHTPRISETIPHILTYSSQQFGCTKYQDQHLYINVILGHLLSS